MDSKLKQKWIEALRSGKYLQGRLRLQTPDGTFCCLGVLCDVDETVKQGTFNDKPIYEFNTGEREDAFLPPTYRVVNDINIDSINALMRMNDTEQRSFSEIADWIEQNM